MLEARNIFFSYGKAQRVKTGGESTVSEGLLINDFNLEVLPGERVALQAPSGFGKTTLCRILAGYLEPQRGAVYVDGAALPKKGVCPVQMIMQHPETAVDPLLRMQDTLIEASRAFEGLSRLSVAKNQRKTSEQAEPVGKLEHPSGQSILEARVSSAAQELLERFGIKEEWLTRYPHELSGGELQRFCIVRALAAEPRYLVADEISTMLDAVTQARIWDGLLKEAEERNLGMIVVTHSAALTKRIATRVEEL